MLSWYKNLRLSWKVLLAPLFFALVMAGVGAYSANLQWQSQAAVGGLMTGPVRQAEAVSDFATSASTSQVHLYRLMATAANESDQMKIATLAKAALDALTAVDEQLKAVDDPAFKAGETGKRIDSLKDASAKYIKAARGVVDMATSDSGAALMLMMGASRAYSQVENLIDDLTMRSKDLRDRKVAQNNMWADQQTKLMITVTAFMCIFGCAVSMLIGRGIAKPVVGITKALRKMGEGDFDTVLPGLDRKDEIGDIAVAVDGRTVQVAAPEDPTQRVAFLSRIESINVTPGSAAAKVIVNARTGSVVMNQTVTVDQCAVAHGNLSVSIPTEPVISQPQPFARNGNTVVAERAQIEIKQDKGQLMMVKGANLGEVVKVLNAIGATPQDLLSILQAMKAAGALRAELEII